MGASTHEHSCGHTTNGSVCVCLGVMWSTPVCLSKCACSLVPRLSGRGRDKERTAIRTRSCQTLSLSYPSLFLRAPGQEVAVSLLCGRVQLIFDQTKNCVNENSNLGLTNEGSLNHIIELVM